MSVVSRSNAGIQNSLDSSPDCVSEQVVSADGTPIGYLKMGRGPGLVILHGGVRAGQHYLRLAKAIANFYTVYLPDRRGRGLSGPVGPNYSITKEMQDLGAILEKTQAKFVFGHSAGGFFALEGALQFPISKLVLYEPAVSIHGSLPFSWLPDYEQAISRNNPALAFVHYAKGLKFGWMSRLPTWLLTPFARLMLSGKDGEEMVALMHTGTWEMREFTRLEQLGQTYERYQKIQAQTLLLAGMNSQDFLRSAARVLSQTIPQARLVELAGLDHNAPDQNAPERVAVEVLRFFE